MHRFNSPVRAHPRACGENFQSCVIRRPAAGSSPRMRGKRRPIQDLCDRVGLIPAHAGKTEDEDAFFWGGGAHPRACGENVRRLGWFWLVLGSSPRMRGKHGEYRGRWWRGGLIPAHAGKTQGPRAERRVPEAHPRACGENTAEGGLVADGWGSSPRMRGKHDTRRDELRGDGLIPAHAGKTMSGILLPYRTWAHPRACGENEYTI